MTCRTFAHGRRALAALTLLGLLAALTLAGCAGGGNAKSAPSTPAVAAPAITGISPTSGPAGTLVTLTGTGFTGANAVDFGGVPAPSFTVVSPTEITAVVPAFTPVARPRNPTPIVDVTVTTPAGTSATVNAGQFSYAAPPPPAVGSVAPATGPAAGGTAVTITGSGFLPGSTVSFGGTAATNVTLVDSTHLTATAPAGSAGAVDVTVTDSDGTSAPVPADQFTYAAAPSVTSLSPTGGLAAGDTSVTVTGTGFTGTTAVRFGGTPAGYFIINSDTQITATSPAGSGTVDVTVSTPGGVSATGSADQFTYGAAPTLNGGYSYIRSGSAYLSQTAYGTNLTPDQTTLTVNGVAATGVSASGSQVSWTSPVSSGSETVVVTTPYGTASHTYTLP